MARSVRSHLYLIARLMGDVQAIFKGRIFQRLFNRVLGRALSRLFIRR